MQQLLSIQALTFLVGLALIVVGSFGGGIEVKEIKIPTLPMFSRALSLTIGIVLLVLCLAFPQIFANSVLASAPLQAPTPVSTATTPLAKDKAESPTEDKPKVWLGADIQNHIITVQDVKRILRHLGKYPGPISDDVNESYFQAVAEFQVSQNLQADGYVGPLTYSKLREAWPDFFESNKSTK